MPRRKATDKPSSPTPKTRTEPSKPKEKDETVVEQLAKRIPIPTQSGSAIKERYDQVINALLVEWWPSLVEEPNTQKNAEGGPLYKYRRVLDDLPYISDIPVAEKKVALAWIIEQHIKHQLRNSDVTPKAPSADVIDDIMSGPTELNTQVGLALADLLGTFFSAFLKPEVLTLGPLETKLISLKDEYERHNYIYSNESNGRIIVFGSFPSFTHIHTPEGSIIQLSEHDGVVKAGSSKERYNQLKNPHLPSKEFYVLRAVLDFCFSNFISYSIEERILILKNVVNFFECKTSFRQLHFFDGPIFPPTIANFMFSFKKGLIYLDFPTHDYSYLEIYNPVLYEELFKFFIDGRGREAEFTDGETSINFITNLLKVMHLQDPTENKLRILYDEIKDPTLRKMFCNCVRKDLDTGLCEGQP